MDDAMTDAGNGSANAETQQGEDSASTDAVLDLKATLSATELALASTREELETMTAERDAAVAKLAKLDAAPKARSGVAKARKVGPVALKDGEVLPTPVELLKILAAADVVELVFSDGARELPIAPCEISGAAWELTMVGLQLRLPELIVIAPQGRALKLAGYGLFIGTKQVAWIGRSDTLDLVPGLQTSLQADVVYTGA